MTDRLDPVTVGIDHKRGEVIRMVLGPHARLAIVSATRKKGGRVKRLNRCAIGRPEAQVHATRRQRIARLDRDGELDAEGACHCAIVRAALLKVDDANDPKWPQYCVIEPAAPLQVSYAERNVVDHPSPTLPMRSNVRQSSAR